MLLLLSLRFSERLMVELVWLIEQGCWEHRAHA
jgi:hypothetical protein